MGKGRVDGIDVIGNAAYDVAGGMGVEISDRKSVQLFKKLFSHGVNNPLAEVHHNYRKKICKHCGNCVAYGHFNNVFPDGGKIRSSGKTDCVNCRAGIFRSEKRKLVRKKGEKNRGKKKRPFP